ncbi:MAG: aldehyde:ferredoxin oxidoreductase, partial [Thermoplasmata archaeon]|nr:aldehyde:ferredoxin oxidoreductase [Thermoplasmata archaeon]
MRGYGGHILHVDVSTGEADRKAMDPEVARLWLGGAGLGAYLVYTRVPAGADPLGPDNAVVFTPGLVNGVPLITPGKCTFTARSPL